VTQQVSVSLSVLQQGMEIAGSVLLLLLVVLLRIIGCLVA
jgi:hypothetical protein